MRNLPYIITVITLHLGLVWTALLVDVLPKSLLEPVGTSVMLHCQTTPADAIVTWEKDNVAVPLYPLNPNNIDENTAYALSNKTLYIKNLKRMATGTYTCKATSGADKRASSAVIEIAYIQKFGEMNSVRVYENSLAKIVCPGILGKPTPTLSWYFNGQPLVGQTTSELIIPSAKLSDAGDYTCEATNIAKTRNVTASLEVIIPGRVEVTPKSGQIYEGAEFEFNCESKAKPPLQVQWRKIENTIEREIINTSTTTVIGGNLTFKNTLPSDKGVYKCFARLNSEDETATAILNVSEYLKIDQNFQIAVQTKDRRMKTNKISCAFRGDDTYNVVWSRLRPDSATLPRNAQVVNNSLIITDLAFEDSGVYQCKANGIANTATGSVELIVFESTRIKTPPKNVTANIGESIWVDCAADGTPQPSVSYMRNDEKGAKPLNATHFKKMSNGTLHVENLQLEDAGPYICWLSQFKSIDGSITASFFINVNVPPVKKETGSMMKTIAIAVGCAGVYILLVIGLMIYCKARRARLMKKGIVTEVDDDEETKDPLLNGMPLQDIKSLETFQYDRDALEDIVTLGHGKMGRVFKANALLRKDSTQRALVAVKEFEDNVVEYKAEFNLEVEMFAQLSHVNVVKLLGICTDKAPFYIIIEYSEQGDLKRYLRQKNSLSRSDRLSIAYGIASGMQYLISLRYMHRDLAARNCIVYADNTVKVSFLSLCEDIYKDDYFLVNQVPVPLRWLSPEAIITESYSEKSDVWSFGVTMWEIFAEGAQPYGEYNDEKVKLGVCNDMRLPKPPDCLLSDFEIMQKCWILDATVRPNFSELTSLIATVNLENENV